MTLERIHVETITRLASAVAGETDDPTDTTLAETVWEEFLPLYRDGRTVIEPLDEKRRRRAPIERVALADRPYTETYGVDSGTLNPTAFKNGLVVDAAQAAMGADPSDLDTHRARSVLVTVHSPDPANRIRDEQWHEYDDGYGRRRALQVPRSRQFASETVHRLALALAESSHALEQLDRHDTIGDLLYLDGPIYPKQLLDWVNRDGQRERIAYGERAGEAVRNYVRLVEECLDRDLPLVGVVKNPTSAFLVRTLAAREESVQTPFQNDTGLYTRLLERRQNGERDRDAVTFTSWFVSRGGADRPIASDGDALGVDRAREPTEYEVTFMLVYEPRQDVLFKIEAPRGFTADDDRRDELTTQVVSEIAANAGPPTAIEKADELARIGRAEKRALREELEEAFGETLPSYDETRWGGE